MKDQEYQLMMSAIKQYYQLGSSQEEIAQKLFVSKSTVSRLLKKAVALGYVEFKIKESGEVLDGLQQKLSNTLDLHCTVVPSYIDEYLVRLNDVCSCAAKELEKFIDDNEVVGVTWGRTTEYLAKNISKPAKEKKNIKICMLTGFVTGTIASMKSTHIIEKFSEVFNAKGFMMPAPLLVDSKEIAQVFYSDSNIKYVMDLCEKAQTVILSVGGRDLKDTFLTDQGSYNLSIYNRIAYGNGVGDIAGRNIDIQGRELKNMLNDRIIGLPLSAIREKKNRICIALGTHKTQAILGAARGKYINRLYTDEITAKHLLQEHKKHKI